MHNTTKKTDHNNQAGLRAATIVTCLLLVGCFDAESLIEERRAIAMQERLEEIDLGEFRVSLPQPSETAEAAEIFFHAFGLVANRDMDEMLKLLEEMGPEFRHRLLLSVRQLTVKDIQDPPLTELRKKISSMVNEILPGEPVQSIGFYRFDYSNL